MHGHEKVLITGGCGAIGSCVVNWLKRKYPNTMFFNLDALTYAGKEEHIEFPHDNYRLYHGDICDTELVTYILEKEMPTLLIHLAAETHVDNSFGNSFKFTKTNILGTHTLLECCRKYGKLKMFLHMSTDEVYGSVQDGDICLESSMFAPSNPYSATKAGAEMLCHAYLKSFHIPVIVTRCNNAISPYQHPEKLVPCAISRIHSGKKVQVHGDGKSLRTFIHGDDIAKALDVIVQSGVIGKVYNIGSSQEYSVLQVVEKVLSILKPSEKLHDWIEFVQDRAFQDYRYSIDSTELRNLGWTDTITFDHALQDCILQYTQRI